MSERLREIKEMLSHQIRFTKELGAHDAKWLIEQAERVQELEKLSTNLNHELFSARTERDKLREEVKALKKSVDFLEKQRERMGDNHQQTIKDAGLLLQQNQRYKQALESIVKEGTLTNFATGKQGYKNGAKIAKRALEADAQ